MDWKPRVQAGLFALINYLGITANWNELIVVTKSQLNAGKK